MNLPDMFGKIKEMQAAMENAQKRLDEITVTGVSGAGMVKVTANANRKILKIELDPEIVNKDDIETLGDLITAAINQAIQAAEDTAKAEMQKTTGSMMPNIPGLDMSKFGL